MMEKPKKKLKSVNVVGFEVRRDPSKYYVFKIHVKWENNSPYIIYRRYNKFFNLQCTLLNMFPVEAGVTNPDDRIIPFIPGKIIFGRSQIGRVAEMRCNKLKEYCKELLKLPEKISSCSEVLKFFSPSKSDLNNLLSSTPDESESDSNFKGTSISGPMQLEMYDVAVAYTKQNPNELNLNVGTKVEVVEKKETGWWFVQTEYDEQGWVPGSYLDRVYGTSNDINVNLVHRSQPGKEEQFVSTASFRGSREDEVSIYTCQVVEVIERTLDGWWKVRSNGVTGYAPGAYLRRADTAKARQLVELGRMSRDSLDVQAKIKRLSRSSIVPPRSIRVSKTCPEFGRAATANKPPLPPAPVRSISENHRPVSVYETMYEYTTPHMDGVSFSQGEQITVVERTANGWWYIQVGDKEGWAPSNYLQPKASIPRPTNIGVTGLTGTKTVLPASLSTLAEKEEASSPDDDYIIPTASNPPINCTDRPVGGSPKGVRSNQLVIDSPKMGFNRRPVFSSDSFSSGMSDSPAEGSVSSLGLQSPFLSNLRKINVSTSSSTSSSSGISVNASSSSDTPSWKPTKPARPPAPRVNNASSPQVTRKFPMSPKNQSSKKGFCSTGLSSPSQSPINPGRNASPSPVSVGRKMSPAHSPSPANGRRKPAQAPRPSLSSKKSGSSSEEFSDSGDSPVVSVRKIAGMFSSSLTTRDTNNNGGHSSGANTLASGAAPKNGLARKPNLPPRPFK